MPVLYDLSDKVSPSKNSHDEMEEDIPRFGLGSSSCAGRENRTAARSETPMNLEHDASRLAMCCKVCSVVFFKKKKVTQNKTKREAGEGGSKETYFLRMPIRVLNLEPSSGAFSGAAFEGVPAREGSFEVRAEPGVEVEPGRAFSADSWSAMVEGRGCGSLAEVGRWRRCRWSRRGRGRGQEKGGQ